MRLPDLYNHDNDCHYCLLVLFLQSMGATLWQLLV